MPTVENQQSYFTSRYFYMQATYLFCIIQEAPNILLYTSLQVLVEPVN